MEVILTEQEWRRYVEIPLMTDKFIEKGTLSLIKQMRELGYMNADNEIVLTKHHTLEGFWNNFDYAFTKGFINYIFTRMEDF